jgi:hypothetical protein
MQYLRSKTIAGGSSLLSVTLPAFCIAVRKIETKIIKDTLNIHKN